MSLLNQRPLRRNYDWLSSVIFRSVDLFSVLLAGWLAYVLRFDTWTIVEERYNWAILFGGLLQIWLFPNCGLYRSWRGHLWTVFSTRLIGIYLLWCVSIMIIMFVFQLFDFSRLWFFGWVALATTFSLLLRWAAYPFVKRLRAQGKNRRSVLLIGDAASCRNAYYSLRRDPGQGFYITRVLVVDYRLPKRLTKYKGVVENYDASKRVHVEEQEVWICLPLSRGYEAQEIINSLDTVTANIRLLPNMSDLRLINHSTDNIAGMHLINVSCSPMTGWSRFKKRCLDVTLSSIILLMILPLLFIVAIGVKLSSPGPIFYRQERVSWNGTPFWMLKFRSMPADSEKGGVQWGNAKGKKVTRFGRFIRRTSLDELPQFINVLKGDMSIVGPRPERTVFVKQFQHEIPGYMQKHLVKAGITGWAQINGWRGDTSLEKRIEFDLWYIDNWSVWLDLRIVLLTIFKGFVNKNAY
ncbi:undecaprenyl-phosphate glucose phosphotransferase [Halomonas sp. NPDC076908]|uniref:undecaprenyl-phosphate glucose phosphotransferase n=1 Tax=Halomonas sp. NPDC076908 TaxID=3390567 RepID=UPI003D08EEEB